MCCQFEWVSLSSLVARGWSQVFVQTSKTHWDIFLQKLFHFHFFCCKNLTVFEKWGQNLIFTILLANLKWDIFRWFLPTIFKVAEAELPFKNLLKEDIFPASSIKNHISIQWKLMLSSWEVNCKEQKSVIFCLANYCEKKNREKSNGW